MYQRIRDLREDRDLLQKDVAAYLKYTQVCYSNYETGKRDIPTEVLIQLARSLPYQYRLYSRPYGRQRPAHPPQSVKLPPKQRDLMRATLGAVCLI